MVIIEALREGMTVQRPPVQEIVANTRSLPSLPIILTKVMELIDSERVDVGELEELIKKDQSLSCRVLAAANSAYCGLSQRVETISRAVVVLGFQRVKECCLGAGLMGVLSPGSSLDEAEAESMWKHSLATAEGAASVARRSGKVEPELAFTAGLLHDLGKVVLSTHMAEVYGRDEGRTWREAELILGVDHQEFGLALAEHWGLPPVLAEVMARHHDPGSSLTHGEPVAAVHVADCLSEFLGGGEPEMPHPAALDRLGLNTDDVNGCLAELVRRHNDIDELWNSMRRI